VSVQTKQALEAAITAHYLSEAQDDNEYRQNAVVVDWIVGFTVSNVVDVDGVGTVGYANGFDSADVNPNGQAYLAQWVSLEIASLLETDRDDD
jgi:hypothetical protein